MAEPARQQSAAEPAIPPEYISATSAASALGKSKRTILLWCQQGKLSAIRDQNNIWWINPRCRTELAIVAGLYNDQPVLAPAGSPLAGMTSKHRTLLQTKRAIVEAWIAYRNDKPIGQTLGATRRQFIHEYNMAIAGQADAKALTERTLRRYEKQYSDAGITGLIDARAHNGQESIMCEDATEFILGLYARQEQPHLTSCYEQVLLVAEREGWEIPSLRAVRKWLGRHDPKQVDAGRDPRKHRERSAPIILRDWRNVYAMDCVIGDHHQFDIFWPRLIWDKNKRRCKWSWFRPWLSAWMDGRSWYCYSHAIAYDSADGDRVMASFMDGVMAHGAPAAVYLDNGKDYRMYRFAGGRKKPAKPGDHIVAQRTVEPILEMFGIRSIWAIPYNARAKTIERWFGIVEEHFGKAHDTYCGNKPAKRPERLKRLHGPKHAREWAIKLLGPDAVEKAESYQDNSDQSVRDELTLSPFQARFKRWLTTDYHRRKSPSAACSGHTVIEAFTQLRAGDFVKRCPAEEDLSLLLMPSAAINVRATGVWCNAHRRHYWSDSLNSLRGSLTRVLYRYKPDDPSRIFVFEASTDRFLAIATPYLGEGIHPLDGGEQLANAMAAQRNAMNIDRKQIRAAVTNADARLASQRLAAEAAGKLGSAESEIVRQQQNQPRLRIKFNADISTASKAAQQHDVQQQQSSRAADFFAAVATGTDDINELDKSDGFDVLDALGDMDN